MMFRKLYWVTEQVDMAGRSRVAGVYTSIPDLIRHGLGWNHGTDRIRLTLTKLDSEQEPLGCWTSPHFDGLEASLQQFVHTDEFSADHCKALLQALHEEQKAVA